MSIVYKKKVEGGVLLYALFMAAVFSLLLQFYLNRQVANQRIYQLSQEKTRAYAIAVLAKEGQEDKEGQVSLKQGRVSYLQKGRQLEVTSQLAEGKSYTFFFDLGQDRSNSEQGEKEKKKETRDKEEKAEAGQQNPAQD